MLTEFNWYELKTYSSNVPEGIIVLTHALSAGYNSFISSSDSSLLQNLNVKYVPPSLYRTGLFVKNKTGIINKYKTEEPQSYFSDISWIYDDDNISHKIIYLYALSQRSITNKNLFIPDTYLDDRYWNNPYLKHRDGKIWFIPELKKLTIKYKLKEKI